MDKRNQIVIVGAGVFGLSTALELSNRGFRNIVVLDRHVPPVPDGSSVDISRIIRFDYTDPVYMKISKEAYDLWSTSPLYSEVFFASPFVLTTGHDSRRVYINKCLEGLDQLKLPRQQFKSAEEAKEKFPTLKGPLAQPDFYGYCNFQAGWADAQLAIAGLRDRCIEAGISFISGARGSVVGLQTDARNGEVKAVRTQSGDIVGGDIFILATGAWTSRLVPMYNSILATGQVLGYLKLTESERQAYKDLPIYINMDSGWFCFPPHGNTGYLKMAVHGWGYTKSPKDTKSEQTSIVSYPDIAPRGSRANFAPEDGIRRLREGLKEILPELETRKFDRSAVCWYTDTPTGDFIIDHHPDHKNLFITTGGSGHAFKFLPVLGRYVADGLERSLSSELRGKWRFRTECRNDDQVFKGDGSRGGPMRREFTQLEKSRL